MRINASELITRITILDMRFALYLPACALFLYLSINSSTAFILMEIPCCFVEAYSLLSFFALMVEYCGGVNPFLDQLLLTAAETPNSSKLSEEMDNVELRYSTVCRSIRMQFLLRPIFVLITVMCSLFAGQLGIAVGIVFHLISIIIYFRGIRIVSQLYYSARKQLKPLRGFSRFCLMSFILLGNLAARSTVFWGLRLNVFSVDDERARRSEIRLVILMLIIFLAFALPYLVLHALDIQHPKSSVLPSTSSSSSKNGPHRSSLSITASSLNSAADIEAAVVKSVKKKPLDERIINVHPDAVYDFDFEAAPPLKAPIVPAIVPPLTLPAKARSNQYLSNVSGKVKADMKRLKTGAGILAAVTRAENKPLSFYSFVEKVFFLHDIFRLLSYDPQ